MRRTNAGKKTAKCARGVIFCRVQRDSGTNGFLFDIVFGAAEFGFGFGRELLSFVFCVFAD